MPCARSSVDSGSYLASAGVKDKELHLFNFTSTSPGLEQSWLKVRQKIRPWVLLCVGHLWFKIPKDEDTVAVTQCNSSLLAI